MDSVRQTSRDIRGSGALPISIDKMPESLERSLERVVGTRLNRTHNNLVEIMERTRESTKLMTSSIEQIQVLQEMNGQLYKKIKQQAEDLKIFREEVIVKLDNQAEDIKGIKRELARLREAIYYSSNSVREEPRHDSSSWNRWFKRD